MFDSVYEFVSLGLQCFLRPKMLHSNGGWSAREKEKNKNTRNLTAFASSIQMGFSSQFIIAIYLHHLIEWFALTNLISKNFDRIAKLSIRLFIYQNHVSESVRLFFSRFAINCIYIFLSMPFRPFILNLKMHTNGIIYAHDLFHTVH